MEGLEYLVIRWNSVKVGSIRKGTMEVLKEVSRRDWYVTGEIRRGREFLGTPSLIYLNPGTV